MTFPSDLRQELSVKDTDDDKPDNDKALHHHHHQQQQQQQTKLQHIPVELPVKQELTHLELPVKQESTSSPPDKNIDSNKLISSTQLSDSVPSTPVICKF